jgi:hypothetical protein
MLEVRRSLRPGRTITGLADVTLFCNAQRNLGENRGIKKRLGLRLSNILPTPP